MKKLIGLLLLLSISLNSCSSDDGFTNAAFITPPQWIHGTWLDGETNSLGYKFTPNDFCKITRIETTCYAERVNQGHGNSFVEQDGDDNTYSITIHAGSDTDIFNFNKVSATEIEFVHSSGLRTIYIKQ